MNFSFLGFCTFLFEWTSITCLAFPNLCNAWIVSLCIFTITFVYELSTLWAYQFSVFFSQQVLFSIDVFLELGCLFISVVLIFEIAFDIFFSTVHIVVIASVSRICYDDTWIFLISFLITVHEWNECLRITSGIAYHDMHDEFI